MQLLGPSFWATVVGVTGGVGDTFDRANSTTLLGTASDGASWTQADTWGINTNQAYAPITTGTGPGGSTLAYRNGGSATTYTLTCDVFTSGEQPGIIFRVQDATNFLLCLLDVSGVIRIYKCVAGAFTALGSASAGYASGATITVSVVTNGTSGDVTAKVNGTSWIVLTAEATLKTQTKVGIYTNAPSASGTGRFDNLTVT